MQRNLRNHCQHSVQAKVLHISQLHSNSILQTSRTSIFLLDTVNVATTVLQRLKLESTVTHSQVESAAVDRMTVAEIRLAADALKHSATS